MTRVEIHHIMSFDPNMLLHLSELLCLSVALLWKDMCTGICVWGHAGEGIEELVADSLYFSERLSHHQHNERAEICGG